MKCVIVYRNSAVNAVFPAYWCLNMSGCIPLCFQLDVKMFSHNGHQAICDKNSTVELAHQEASDHQEGSHH